MTAPASSLGTFGVVVWPAYVGACQADPGPGPTPYGEPTGLDYKRGQIQWEVAANGEIVGRAFVHVGPGYYTHLGFFSGPEGPCMVGKRQLPHPLDWHNAPVGTIEIYPITNPDLGLNKAQGC